MKLLRHFSLALFLIGAPLFSVAQTFVVAYNSDSNTFCNGGAYLTDSTAILETSIWWAGGGAVLQQGGYGIIGLCPGTYTVTFSYNGMSMTETFIVGNNNTDPCSSLVVNVSGAGPSSPTLCDGYASATATGGTAPYSFSWDSGDASNSISGLCNAVYCVNVVDAVGCLVTVCISLSNNDPDSILVIDNTNGFDSTDIDGTIGGNWIEDCEIDFGAIDSAFAQGGSYNAGVVEVTWVFLDTNGVIVNTYTTFYTVGDSLNGNYTVSVTVFCPQRANGINTISVTDVVAFGDVSGIVHENMEHLKFVNPFGDELVLEFDNSQPRQVQIIDLSGKVLFNYSGSNETVRIPALNWNSGVFNLTIFTHDGIVTKKIIKF
ncbi:MAG: T9SS type A sorting domain-containing protein [Bacteroidota bacterium]